MNLTDLGNLGANMLFGYAQADEGVHQPMDALNAGVIELRRRGHSVRPAEGIPGLWEVGGMGELTTNQVRSFAPSF